MTWLPILPAILLQHMKTLHRLQQETSQVLNHLHSCEVVLESTLKACQRSSLTWPLLPAPSVLRSEQCRRQVPAVMSEVAQWHMRTRLYFRLSTGLSEADPFLVTTGDPSKNCRLQWYDRNIFLLFFHDLHCRLDDVCIICTWSKLWINYC